MTTEKVHFKMFRMPCCNHQLCWVNPRLPSYCPECGAKAYTELKFRGDLTFVSDPNATLKYSGAA